ncbi:hypothetical protein M5D96_014203, partial [Drosophila gunungcola]
MKMLLGVRPIDNPASSFFRTGISDRDRSSSPEMNQWPAGELSSPWVTAIQPRASIGSTHTAHAQKKKTHLK